MRGAATDPCPPTNPITPLATNRHTGQHSPCPNAGPGIVRVGPAGDQAPGLALVYQLRHGLLGHARALGQVGQPVAPQGQVPREVDVRGAHLVACGQVGQGQGHFHIARHELQHPRIKAPHGVAQQPAQVGLAPGIVRRGGAGGRGVHGGLKGCLVNGKAN